MSQTANRYLSYSWLLVWLALPLSMQYTVMFLWLFGLMVVYDLVQNGVPKIDKSDRYTAALFLAYLAWQSVSLFFDPEHTLWWKTLEKKAAFLVVPLLLIFSRQSRNELQVWAFRGFLLGLTLAGMMLVANGFGKMAYSGQEFIYYHEFADVLPHGAIYLSWYFAVALITLVAVNPEPAVARLKPYLLIFFSIILLLLASKLFILLTIPYLAYQLFRTGNRSRRNKTIAVASLVLLVLLSLPFLYRMSELRNTDFKVLQLKEYRYDTPFNGLTFRLLQWRLASEMMNSPKKMMVGNGLQSTQDQLNSIYREKGIYTGNPDLGDSGYLDYNFHNQFLETLVSTGIPGLLILLLIILRYFFNQTQETILSFTCLYNNTAVLFY